MAKTTNLPKAEILQRYRDGETIQSLADRFFRAYETMRGNLLRWGAEVRRTGPKRTHELNEHYFDVIATEERAYWLGFFLADGSVVRTGAGNWCARVELANDDIGHLEKLKRAVSYSGPVRRVAEKKSAYLSFASRVFCDGLIRHKCYPNKTAEHGTPEIQNHLYRHLYRGATDGDGSLLCYNNTWRYEYVGSPMFVARYQDWLMRNADVGRTKLIQHERVVSVRYTGTAQVRRIANLLYADAKVYLDRKYERYVELRS